HTRRCGARRASSENLVTGYITKNTATARRPRSRTISDRYAGSTPSASSPPPPKQPQSILNPRAHADAIPVTNAASSNADAAAATRVATPTSSNAASTSSTIGRAAPSTTDTSYGVNRYAWTARPDAARSPTFAAPAASHTPASSNRPAVPTQGTAARHRAATPPHLVTPD